MPYSIEEDVAECDGYAVVKDSDGTVMGCHETEAEAAEQIAAIEASEDERAEGVDTTPTEAMQDAARRGLEMHEEGKGGDGLEGATVREAQRMADGEPLTEAKVRKGNAFWGRNENYCNEGASDAQVTSRLLWGGCGSIDWFARKYDAFENPDDRMRADADDLSTGDRVRWDSSGGTAYGEIEARETSGTISAEPDGPTMKGTEDNPAFGVRVYQPGDDGWEASDVLTVHRAGALTKIEGFPEDRSAPAVHTGLQERGPQLGQYQRRTYNADVRRSSDDQSTTVIINTDAVDGHGTIVDPEGMRLQHGNRRFSRNFFINHDMNLLAGHSPDPQYRGGSLQVQVHDDAWDHEDELIARWYRKVKNGLLGQASIGFMPIDGEYEERHGQRVYRYTEWMLREWSFVPIASNPEADVMSRTPALRLEQRLTRIEQQLAQVAPEVPDPSEASSRAEVPDEASADQDPEGKSQNGSQATDDSGESAAQRVITIEDAKRLLREHDRKRDQKAEEIAKRTLGMA